MEPWSIAEKAWDSMPGRALLLGAQGLACLWPYLENTALLCKCPFLSPKIVWNQKEHQVIWLKVTHVL